VDDVDWVDDMDGENVKNKLRVVSQARALLADSQTEAPGEIVLFPPGRVTTTKTAPFMVDEPAARRVIASFSRLGRDIVIDYDHATFLGEARYLGAAPAAGWIRGLRWDPAAGLLARVDWTARAKGLIEAREYRYHSPAMFLDEADRLQEIVAGALTNNPATHDALPLVASRILASREAEEAAGENKGDRMQAIAQVLGLGPEAGLDAILAAVNEGIRNAQKMVAEEMTKVAGGLKIPGLG